MLNLTQYCDIKTLSTQPHVILTSDSIDALEKIDHFFLCFSDSQLTRDINIIIYIIMTLWR